MTRWPNAAARRFSAYLIVHPPTQAKSLGRAGACVLALILAGGSVAQVPPKPAASGASTRPPATSRVEQGPSWSALKPGQREALKPLERDWANIDTPRKQKWLEIADRYPNLPPQDQARLQARMTEWASLTPQERGQARLNYQQAKQSPAQDRQASWEAYQALPPEQRRELAVRTMTASSGTGLPGPLSAPGSSSPTQADRAGRAAPQPKSNTVPDSALAAPPKPVAPSVVQAQPGATTTLISKPATPPAHQPIGMPKIAATPEFVDKKTLLPQTGAQSTAPRAVAASAPPQRP